MRFCFVYCLPACHTFRNDLNSSLRSEVDLFMNREILSSNTMFSKVSDSVLIAIVSTLQNQVFLEGDYIIRKVDVLGVKIFGVPHHPSSCFPMNDTFGARRGARRSIYESANLAGVHIFATHCPPFGVHDLEGRGHTGCLPGCAQFVAEAQANAAAAAVTGDFSATDVGAEARGGEALMNKLLAVPGGGDVPMNDLVAYGQALIVLVAPPAAP